MKRGRERAGAVYAIVPTLYLAWFLSWCGTVVTTCTMADSKSLGGGMIFSVLFYAAAILRLYRSNLGTVGAVLALPLAFLLLRQAAWAVELFVVVHLNGRTPCTLITGMPYSEPPSDWEYVYPFYYFGISAASLLAVAASYWRHLRAQRPTTKADIN